MHRGVVLKMVISNAAWRTSVISHFERLARARIIFVNPVIKKKKQRRTQRRSREKALQRQKLRWSPNQIAPKPDWVAERIKFEEELW